MAETNGKGAVLEAGEELAKMPTTRQARRQELYDQLARLSTSELIDLLEEPAAPRIEVPESIDEEKVWPLVLKRQITTALRGTGRDALESSAFLAKVWGKEKRAPMPRPGSGKADEHEDFARVVAAAEKLDHEPGDPTRVDSEATRR